LNLNLARTPTLLRNSKHGPRVLFAACALSALSAFAGCTEPANEPPGAVPFVHRRESVGGEDAEGDKAVAEGLGTGGPAPNGGAEPRSRFLRQVDVDPAQKK
jgi:hypothetical protein